MGLLDSLPLISNLYNGEKSYRIKRSRSQISQTVPFNPQISTDAAVPQSPDLESARGLEQTTDIPSLDLCAKNWSLDGAGFVADLALVDEGGGRESPELDRYATAMTKKSQGTAEPVYEELCLSSTGRSRDSKRSGLRRKGYWGLEEFKKFLSHYRMQKGSSSEPGRTCPSGAFVDGGNGYSSLASHNNLVALPPNARDAHPMAQGSKVDVQPESRKVSNKTVLSDSSERTTVTVCRHPSRRVASPITTIESGLTYDSSCSDVRHSSYLRVPSLVKTEPGTPGPSPRIRSSVHRASSGGNATDHEYERPEEQVIYHRPRNKSNISLEMLSQRLYSGSSTVSVQIRQQRAIDEFNLLAKKLVLRPLDFRKDNASGTAEPPSATVEKPQHPKQGILRKIHSMRSSLHLRHYKSTTTLTLRHMKTFASLSNRCYQMDSLKGRPLEILARFGGYSFLSLPADFAPTTLKLPACMVATAAYLKSHAPRTRHVFFDSGDLRAAARMYDHFANQVLSAEKGKDKVDITMRGCELPTGSFGSDSDYLLRGRFHALSVACVFKRLLAGLPGGILGSVELYRALVDISNHCFSDCEIDRAETRLAGVSPTESTRIKVITLAILALTSDMQLELICAVFGLCALMIHETERMVELQRQKKGLRGRSISVSGLLDMSRLGLVFGPLLTETEDSDNGSVRDTERECENARVTTMMIENWRGVSRQLRLWETFGYFSRVGSIPAIVCNDHMPFQDKRQ